MLHADFLEGTARRGIKLCALTAMRQVDLVHVVHEIQRLLLADVSVEITAKIIGDVVLAVRECPRATESTHDGTTLTADASLDLVAIDRAMASGQLVPFLEHRDGQLRG